MSAALGDNTRPGEAGSIRLTVTRGSVQQDLAGFPLYVQIDSVELERLRTEGLALDPCEGLRFLDASGAELPHVIDSYDSGAGMLRAWVRIPLLASGEDTILSLTSSGSGGDSDLGEVFDDHHRYLYHQPMPSDKAAHVVAGEGRGRPQRELELAPSKGLTVEGWVVTTAEPRTEAFQVIAAQWPLAEVMNGFATYDAGLTDDLETRGFFGAVCAGRYVYFSPQCNSEGRHGKALRYDTHGGFDDSCSWAGYDAGSTEGLATRGYYGAVFDGRYVYYVPRTDGDTHHSRLLRHDTQGDFREPSSWSAFDAGEQISFQGGAFDGRYVYFSPGYHQETGPSGKVLRFDTRADFHCRDSYATFDAAGTSGLPCTCFDGAVFDGRFVYFVPLESRGTVLRYDSQAEFAEPASWEAWNAHDTSGLEMGMCVGAIFDGQYVYFVPYANSVVVRYDTNGGFGEPASWEAYEASGTSAMDTRGFDGAVFDGRYIYFIPFWEGDGPSTGFHARLLRYDTLGRFGDAASWKAADGSAAAPPNPGGFNGGAFDGRYIYLAPWREDDTKGEGAIVSHGQVLRYDTAAEGACFQFKFMDCGHNGGLCGAVPGPAFLVNTERGPVSVSARSVPVGVHPHHIAGVYDGESMQLFVDGELVGEAAGNGPVVRGSGALSLGQLDEGGAQFAGNILHLRVSDVARSAAWIQAAAKNMLSPGEFAQIDV